MTENHVLVVLDAARYDVYDDQEFENLPNNALVSYSACCWTLPSLFSMLLGYSPANAERWAFNSGGQSEWIPEALQRKGYYTAFHSGSAWLALPHIREIFSKGFDRFDITYKEQRRARDMDEADFSREPFFHVFHLLETHHPFRTSDGKVEATMDKESNWEAQEEALHLIDGYFGDLVDELPKGTTITVTADHADSWGEHGWGHNVNSANMEGFMLNEVGNKVMEIPYARGRKTEDGVAWEKPEDLQSEWEDPREADFE